MKFTLVEAPTFWWPVTVRVPDPDAPGKTLAQDLRVQFTPKTRDEEIALNEAFAALTTDRERADAEIANWLDIVVGWDGVIDGNGHQVAFSQNALRAALQWQWFRSGLAKAFADSAFGLEAQRGN